MKKTAQEPKVTENPLYHDTWMLLRKYRDVVWSLELSVQQVRRQFQIEYGSSIEEFLESLYVAGITFEGSAIEDHAVSGDILEKNIEWRSLQESEPVSETVQSSDSNQRRIG